MYRTYYIDLKIERMALIGFFVGFATLNLEQNVIFQTNVTFLNDDVVRVLSSLSSLR